MSLRDRIKERKGIKSGQWARNLIICKMTSDRLANDRWKVRVVNNLKTGKDFWKCISKKIKFHYLLIGRKEHWRSAIEAAIKECKSEMAGGGIVAAQEWWMQFLINLENEQDRFVAGGGVLRERNRIATPWPCILGGRKKDYRIVRKDPVSGKTIYMFTFLMVTRRMERKRAKVRLIDKWMINPGLQTKFTETSPSIADQDKSV